MGNSRGSNSQPEAVGLTGRPLREFPEPQPLDSHGPARIIAMCNQKGGVGKTTSTINLGACLAEAGRRVLLVDLDPQAALSAGLGVRPDDQDFTIYDLLFDAHASIESVLVKTGVPGLDLVPASIDLSAAEIQLVNEVGREQALARVLRPVMKEYDYIILDCLPSLGLLTVNALACAHGVIVPMECEYFASRGLNILIDTLETVRDRVNFNLELVGILVTMFDRRTRHSQEVITSVVKAYGEQVFDTVITRTVRFPETSYHHEPIITWASNSPGAQQYRQLAREVVLRTSG